MTTGIILASGKSTRMGGKVDKAFFSLVNKPVVAWSLLAFEKCAAIDRIVLVVRKDQLAASQAVVKMFGISKVNKIVAGGARRQDSVQAGLAVCDVDTRLVVIHDGARPLVTPEMITDVLEPLKKVSAATLGQQVTDTIKLCEKGTSVSRTVSRDKLWAVQTPQAFNFRELQVALKEVKEEVTDECMALEQAGKPVKIVENFKPNFKITVPEDLLLAAQLLK